MAVVVGFSWPIFRDYISCAVVDGRLAFASEEERYTRHKHSDGEPSINALRRTFEYLKGLGIKPSDVDAYAINYSPGLFGLTQRKNAFLNSAGKVVRFTNQGLPIRGTAWAFLRGMDYSRLARLLLRHVVESMGDSVPSKFKILPVANHLAYAASAYYFSGFGSSTIITMDGGGEFDSTAVWKVTGGEFENILEMPTSFGSPWTFL
jgi:carbamoyltransferase